MWFLLEQIFPKNTLKKSLTSLKHNVSSNRSLKLDDMEMEKFKKYKIKYIIIDREYELVLKRIDNSSTFLKSIEKKCQLIKTRDAIRIYKFLKQFILINLLKPTVLSPVH